MADKQSFYEEIGPSTDFGNAFFKKVLGYSMYDESFFDLVASKLVMIGRKDVIELYNNWYCEWKVMDNQEMKKVAAWYQKERDKRLEKEKHMQEKAVKEWKKIERWTKIANNLNYRQM